jgi:hypothetical protein
MFSDLPTAIPPPDPASRFTQSEGKNHEVRAQITDFGTSGPINTGTSEIAATRVVGYDGWTKKEDLEKQIVGGTGGCEKRGGQMANVTGRSECYRHAVTKSFSSLIFDSPKLLFMAS